MKSDLQGKRRRMNVNAKRGEINRKELFIRNGKLQYKYNRYLTQGLGDIALSQNGVAKQGIIYESVDIGEIIQVHDYLFANLVYDGTNCPDKIAVSKDGVYFTIISTLS